MPLFEITPHNFDGGTDKQDADVLWVKATTLSDVQAAFPGHNVTSLPSTIPPNAFDVDLT